MTASTEALRMSLADGFIAEFRLNGSVAILHDGGGLHMAQLPEIAMANEIRRLRAVLAAHDAAQPHNAFASFNVAIGFADKREAQQQEPDLATPDGGIEAGPEEDRIEIAYWSFDARRSGYAKWAESPMSERDAFKAEMRNALGAEKMRAEMRLIGRGWRKVQQQGVYSKADLEAEFQRGRAAGITQVVDAQQQEPYTPQLVEDRLNAWRQRLMNQSGDRLALDDFMGQESIDDLIDFVCAPTSRVRPSQDQADVARLEYLLFGTGWTRADLDAAMKEQP
jgi:hypothetical protein